MTYEEWFWKYLTLYKQGLKPRTLEEYKRLHAAHIAPRIGSMEIAAIMPADVQEVIVAAAIGSGSRTSQAVYSLLHAVFRRAARSWLIDRSPVDPIDKPAHDPEAGRQLTEEDYAATLPHVRDDLALSLALFAGLRRGEIAGLRWGDVDLQDGVLHIRRQRHRINGKLQLQPPKSSAGVRDVPIAPQLLPLLRASYRLYPAAFVVPVSPETITRRWSLIQERDVLLSQHYRLHDLRHTYGSRLILAGCNVRVVQYLMGHSSLDVTTRVYSHCDGSQARRETLRVYAAALH